MKNYPAFLLTLCVISIFSDSAFAHTGIGDLDGFQAGFWHPIGGADHLLAMIAVGLWAVQLGGKSIWIMPTAFVTLMMLGGILALAGMPFPYVEEGILTSVLVLGILITAALKFRLPISVSIIGIFALFHGHAHGAEMPIAIEAISYCIGFALSTALLHAAGITGGFILHKLSTEKIIRWTGSAITFGGIYLAVV